MEGEYRKWARSTRIYGGVNVAARLVLIIASAIVAAGKTLTDSLAGWIPFLALIVAIVTAVDSWLKPREKWRGFMEDRDDLDDLLIRAKASQSASATPSDQLREKFRELRRRHRNKNVY